MRFHQSFGMSKIGMLRGDAQEGPYGATEQRQKRSGSGGTGSLFFSLDADAGSSSLMVQPPSFNVLYVATPRIGLLQTPEWQAVSQLWRETVELVRPALRFGLPETSLATKCKHYDDQLYASGAGIMLANDRTRTLIRGIAAGAITPIDHHHHQPQPQEQQQQPQPGDASSSSSSSVEAYRNLGPLGFNTLSFIASRVLTGQHKQHAKQQQQADAFGVVEQHPERTPAIPPRKLLVPDIPSGSLVLALNLMAYWAITKQAPRSSIGGGTIVS